jgi:hypothetical protein
MKQPVQKKYIRASSIDESFQNSLQNLSLSENTPPVTETPCNLAQEKQVIASFKEAVQTARFLAIAKVSQKDRLQIKRPGCKRCGKHTHVTAFCNKKEPQLLEPPALLPILHLSVPVEVSA